MPGRLLATKFHVPATRPTLVARPRLTERLERGRKAALTLVSAPAGFGKTTLLSDWLAEPSADERPVAWLSLDQRDNDPVLFWNYVVAAFQRAAPGVGGSVVEALGSGHPNGEAIVGGLLADLDTVSHDVILVLEDYHLIDSAEVHKGVALLVEHLPPQVQLVIATRSDPHLPLARLRAGGDLIEIRAADLRFTADEAAAYLTDAMGLALTEHEVAALEGRTEGWIVALQLAALSLQGREDPASFIESFSGDDRFIVDYLVEEVLRLQPERVRDFLLQTSILRRLTGPLCDALTGNEDGGAMLETLERTNLFVVPLDDQRRWYRYHHLFADVLAARLRDEAPETIGPLHRRASTWYEADGNLPAAIRHALVSGDPARAADLVEVALPAMSKERDEASMRHWLDALPEALVRSRPVLAVYYVGTRMLYGDIDGIEPFLDDAERALDASAASADPQLRRLTGMVAAYRAALAQSRGDSAGTAVHARRAFELADADDHLGRGASAGLSGLASWSMGDLEAARESWTQAIASLDRAGHLSDTMGGSIALAEIALAQGRFRDAAAIFASRLARAADALPTATRGVADMHVGLAGLLCARGDLGKAREHLDAAHNLGEAAGLPQNAYRWRMAAAQIQRAEGDLAAAATSLDEAERVFAGDLFPNVRPIPAMRARVRIAQGRVAEALAWARERGVTADDELTYLAEYEHVTLAMALVAQGLKGRDEAMIAEATRFLERLSAAAELGGRTGRLIDILVVETLAAQARDDAPAALESLRRALALAEPERYVGIFVNVGGPLVGPLKALAKEGSTGGFAREVLAAFGAAGDGPRGDQGLIEPLSARELDVLRLLRSDLDGPEIARQLFVSVNTLHTHTKSIFTKLGVNNRRAAIRAADALGLVARGTGA
jgi:LuxR family maltose regulon positive regulatory protein